jgi:hypothetical protein
MRTYRIMLADDHALIREGLKRVIEGKSAFKVISEASDGLELINNCQVPQHRLPGCATASFTFNLVKVPQHRLPGCATASFTFNLVKVPQHRLPLG